MNTGPSDRLGRPLRDLRLSLTDRCNFRCTYCMPKALFGADHAFLPRSYLLSFEEIERAVRLFVELGVSKLRLTGGEPLLRRDIDRLIARLTAVPGIEDTCLTTNASLLTMDRARALRDAGLGRVTVSLDALDEAVFQRINDVGFPVARVLDGIDNALRAGLAPVKINAVIQRGVNDDQIEPMADYFRGSGCVLRFIEYMDVGASNGWRLEDVVPSADIRGRIDARWPLQPVAPTHPGEVARRWCYRDGAGEVGFINSVTQPFCSSCTRARLSAEGQLYTCLFGTSGHDLRARLRSGLDDSVLGDWLAAIWTGRRDRYSEERTAETAHTDRVEMSYIGG